jgi:hypothetical protein
MNKNMPNKAIFQKSQMFITAITTRNYNEKREMNTWSKQTQSKPILPARVACKIALPVRHSLSDGGSAVEGPVVSLPNRFYMAGNQV